MLSTDNPNYKDYCCSDRKEEERTKSSGIPRQSEDSNSGSYPGKTPKNISSNLDLEYKIHEQEDTLPSKNDIIYHDESNAQKSLGGGQDDTSFPPPPSLYVSESSNMDYVSLAGVCKRTGSDETQLVGWVIRQLVDNSLDSCESQYDKNKHSPRDVYVSIETKYDASANQFIIIVSNPNLGKHENGFTEARINSIFEDLDQFVSSKRNLFKLTRGYQGDALKEILGIPTALATKYDNDKEWNEPLIIRNGTGQEFEIRVVVDKINGRNYATIKTNPTSKFDNITQIEFRVPYHEDIIDLSAIKVIAIKYALLNTHIDFYFNLVTFIDSNDLTIVYKPYKQFLPATQEISISETSYKKLTRIYHFPLSTFENLLYGIEDQNLEIYNEILRSHFKEGPYIKGSDDLRIPIGQLKQMTKKDSLERIKDIFFNLRNVRLNQATARAGPSQDDIKTKRDMFPFDFKKRAVALKARAEQLGYFPNDIDYKATVGYHYSNPDNIANISDSQIDTCVAYVVEVAVIHTENLKQNLLYCEGINASPNQYGSLTYDQYSHEYTTKGGSLKTAVDATDLLRQCGYENNPNCKKEKEKSMVLLNLWSPVIDYKEYGKSFIVLDPFEHDIYDTLGRMCSKTNKPRSSKGETLSTKRLLTDFIIDRYKKILLDPSIKKRDPWKTSTVVYRKRPDLEAKGLYPTRKYIQGLVKTICEELEELRVVLHGDGSYHFESTGVIGVKREALGIYEATRAYVYFRGTTYPVSLQKLEELKTMASFIVIIEKEGVVELLTHWANLYGIALCYTRGFLTDNAKELSKLADESGCRIVFLSDMDFAGRVMGYLIPNISRIGITLKTLKTLGLELTPDLLEELPAPKTRDPNKVQHFTYLNQTHATTAKKMYEDGLISEDDWEIMAGCKYGQRIEIDNIIAAVGAERFWKEIILASYEDLFDTADMTMSLKQIDYVTLSSIQLLNECVKTHCKADNKSKIEEIDSEYNKYNYVENGFIEDIDAEESEISDRIEKHELANESNSWLNDALVPIIEEYQKRTKLDVIAKEKPKVELNDLN